MSPLHGDAQAQAEGAQTVGHTHWLPIPVGYFSCCQEVRGHLGNMQSLSPLPLSKVPFPPPDMSHASSWCLMMLAFIFHASSILFLPPSSCSQSNPVTMPHYLVDTNRCDECVSAVPLLVLQHTPPNCCAVTFNCRGWLFLLHICAPCLASFLATEPVRCYSFSSLLHFSIMPCPSFNPVGGLF